MGAAAVVAAGGCYHDGPRDRPLEEVVAAVAGPVTNASSSAGRPLRASCSSAMPPSALLPLRALSGVALAALRRMTEESGVIPALSLDSSAARLADAAAAP